MSTRPGSDRWDRVITEDGRALRLTTAEPDGRLRGVVLVAPAMATPSGFYRPFLLWLAASGFRAVTFDFRGQEDRRTTKNETGDLDRWIADASEVLDAVVARSDGLPITWVGHSLGGQILPLVDHDQVTSVLLIAAGDAYWRHSPRRLRRWLPLLWWVVAPASVRVCGYFPGARLRIMTDLPAGVMRQWARWVRHPEYLEVDHPDAPELYAAVRAPITSISFTDDEIMGPGGIQSLLDRYRGAPQIRHHLSPEQLGVTRLGHHGFFRQQVTGHWDTWVLPWLAT